MKVPEKPKTSTPPRVGDWRYTHNGVRHLVTDVGNWMPQGEGYPLPLRWASGRTGYARTSIEVSRGLMQWDFCTAVEDLLTRDEYLEYRRRLSDWHRYQAGYYEQLARLETDKANALEKPL